MSCKFFILNIKKIQLFFLTRLIAFTYIIENFSLFIANVCYASKLLLVGTIYVHHCELYSHCDISFNFAYECFSVN